MNQAIEVKVIEGEDWDFKGADTQYMTHCLHPYPARMVPQIAKRLLRRYASKGDLLLEPFCGSGGVLVEARLAGVNSIGIDVNPLACLLGKAKSHPIDPEILRRYWTELKSKIRRDIALFKFRQLDVDLPDFSGTNMEYWFMPDTMKELAIIRNHLAQVENSEIRNFLLASFSITARKVSGTRGGEFKLYRIPEEKRKGYQPDTLRIFVERVEVAIKGMEEFYSKANHGVFSKIFSADTRKMLTKDFPEEANEILLGIPPKVIITSPPYGDSRTTVAYGQFSRLSSLWLEFEEMFKRDVIMNVDKISLGGELNNLIDSNSLTLNSTLEAIQKKSERREKETFAFFSHLYTCLKNLYKALDKGGHCCIVIANRTVSRIQIPTHIITTEMGVNVGFENNVIIIPRRMPTKRLPWENAPENIPGFKGKTMSKENIIIMRKPK